MWIEKSMNNHPTVNKAIKVVHSECCPTCRRPSRRGDHPIVTIESIEDAGDSWIAQGKGKSSQSHEKCMFCRDIYLAIVTTMPIDCSEFPCPACGKFEHLVYRVKSIDVRSSIFEFIAEIRCNKCEDKNRIQNLIKRFIKAFSIEVSPKGVSIKKA